MPKANQIPEATYPAGIIQIPETGIAGQPYGLRIWLTRVGWPDIGSDVVRFSLDVSHDNGLTWWPEYFRVTAAGGPAKYHTSVQGTLNELKKQGGNPQIKIRGEIEFFTDLTTEINVGYYNENQWPPDYTDLVI